MKSIFWNLIDVILILIFIVLVGNNLYISLAYLVRVKFLLQILKQSCGLSETALLALL